MLAIFENRICNVWFLS